MNNLADTYSRPGEWTSYDVFSVLSGIAMIAVVFVPGLRTRERVLSPLLGIGLIIYDIHVRSATYGTYYFPVQIFVIPFLFLGLGIYRWYQYSQRTGEGTRPGPSLRSEPYRSPSPSPLDRVAAQERARRAALGDFADSASPTNQPDSTEPSRPDTAVPVVATAVSGGSEEWTHTLPSRRIRDLRGTAAAVADPEATLESSLPATSDVLLDTGDRLPLSGPVLIGRDPANQPGESAGLLALPDPSFSVSKTHLLLTPTQYGVEVVDRHSTNGVRIDRDGGEIICPPGAKVQAHLGDTIRFGDRSLTLGLTG